MAHILESKSCRCFAKLDFMAKLSVESSEEAAPRIILIRGQRVLLDTDLAALYGVTTKRLNEQVRRNADRFPEDFLLELSNQEVAALRSQIATLNAGRGTHRKYLPTRNVERFVAALDANTRKQQRRS